ncbi:MAG TPA: ATP-dependent DNA ligase [Anaeromyxobacter sp.]|nr:ATP-dependent DNA ligase [Anaeromyxobacter sp.]
MLLADVARTSRDAAATRSRNEKTALLARLLRALPDGERGLVVSWLSGDPAQGRIGVGFASVRDARATSPAAIPSLAVSEVHAALGTYAAARGPGSGNARRALLADLFARAVPEERDFLAGLLTGELRQGALEGLLAEAVAQAAGAPADDVRRAAMLAGSLPAVAEAVLGEGPAALARFRLRVLAPVQPMLAQTAEDVADALARLGPAALEWKLDGARVQVHRDGDAVRIFSRTGRDVTAALPEVAAVVRAAPARALVLDGEALAMRTDGTPEPFQRTMRRFGRKLAPGDAEGEDAVELDPERLAPGLPLTAFFFDVLHRDGADLLGASNAARRAALEAVIPPAHLVPRMVPGGAAEAEAFLEDALARGHEGVVAKALDAPYEAGRRGGAWLKVKRAHTLDLVVLAVEPGSGRRRGWLSNLHLGARDPATGGFVMLGKTFKGMTDAMLAWQTERLRSLAVSDDGYVVRVRPELVVEVAFDGIQASSRYEGGLALRFARVKRYREDKRPEDADTIETVRAIYAGTTGAASGDGRASSETQPASVRT